MKTFPLEIITGSGLGTSAENSQTGRTFPAPGMGEASIGCLHNICTGNLTILDYKTSCEERNFPVELQYVYNSQAKNPASLWRLSHKQLNAPGNPVPPPPSLVLVEADGHESTYTWEASKQCYYSPADASGRALLRFDEENNLWIWFHPATRMTERFDTKGRLISRCDALNRETTFLYQDENPLLLTGIKAPGGHYRINRSALANGASEEALSVLKAGSETPLLLRKWTFDRHGRLGKSDICSSDGVPYSIVYKHSDNIDELNHLQSISQTDGSHLSFSFNSGNVLASATHGLGETKRTMEFQGGKAGADTIHEVKLGCYSMLLFTGNDNRLTKREELYSAPGFNKPAAITRYQWKNDRIDSIVAPDGGVERFTYQQDEAGQLVRHQLPHGQDIHHVLDAAHDFLHTNTWETTEDGQILVTRKVFDHDMACEGQGKKGGTALRFSISPEGRVTEYRYDARGELCSERVWLDALHTESHAPDVCIALADMELWTGKQDASRVSLVQYSREERNQTITITKTTFALVDSEGNGKQDEDEQADVLVTTHDIHGNILVESRLQSLGYAPAIKERKPDALGRTLTATDAMGQTTTHIYDLQKDNNCMRFTVHPDGREEAVLSNNLGMSQCWQKAMQNERQVQRTTTIEHGGTNSYSRTVKTPDGLSLVEFLDGKDEIIFTLDSSGRGTIYHHDRIHNVRVTTIPGEEIEHATLLFNNYPTTTSLARILTSDRLNDTCNREKIECMDLAGRLRYKINPRGAVTEMRYDNRSNLIATIRYDRFLTGDEISLLKLSGKLDLPVNPEIDRCTRSFHDRDGLLIAEQDEAGYVTEYIRNGAGWITEEILYDTPVAIDFAVQDFSKVRPATNSQKDAHTYHFHNNRGLTEITINPDRQITEKNWLANGLLDKTRIYATRISRDFLKKPLTRPVLPAKSTEDTVIQKAYDFLDRVIHTVHANDSLQHTRIFNPKTGLLERDVQADDAVFAGKVAPNGDNYRATFFRHDGFGQTVATAPPMLAEKMAAIEGNLNFSNERKAALLEMLWKYFSTRHVYDDSGLCIKTITSKADIYETHPEDIIPEMAFDHIQHQFYDKARRPVVTMTPLLDGRILIEENEYNIFGDIIWTCQYGQSSRHFPTDKISTLQGGFLQTDLWHVLNVRQNSGNDTAISRKYGKTSLCEYMKNPMGFDAEFTHNAFDECVRESRCINTVSRDTVTGHIFNTRGLITKTSICAPDIQPLITCREYESPLQKCTRLVTPSGLDTQFEHDSCGREITSTAMVDGQAIRERIVYDVLGRIIETINPVDEHTTRKYKRTLRKMITMRAEIGLEKMNINNVFGELVQQTDGLGNTVRWTHCATGIQTSTTSASGAVIRHRLNLDGENIAFINQSGMITLEKRDECGEIHTRIEDAGNSSHLNLTTTFVRNNLGRPVKIKSAGGLVTKYEFNQGGEIEHILRDPDGLELATLLERNPSNQLVRESRGTPSELFQYQKEFIRDGIGRDIWLIIDPNELEIEKRQILISKASLPMAS